MLAGIVDSYLFGLVIALSVGPIALLIFNYGLTAGWRIAALAGAGAAVADLLYATVAFTVGSQVVASLASYQLIIRGISSFALIAIGVWSVKSACHASPNIAREALAKQRRPFATTLGLTSINPLTITVFMSFALQLPQSRSTLTQAMFVASVFVGSLCGQLTFAIAGAVGATLLTTRQSVRFIGIVSGCGIVAFGIYGLLRSVI